LQRKTILKRTPEFLDSLRQSQSVCLRQISA
jgi:hypothetical protein